ncbi:unnamed protein product [Trichobilharzia regenti]|nr:unnamed protein product [Trichobilharzia regenti]
MEEDRETNFIYPQTIHSMDQKILLQNDNILEKESPVKEKSETKQVSMENKCRAEDKCSVYLGDTGGQKSSSECLVSKTNFNPYPCKTVSSGDWLYGM